MPEEVLPRGGDATAPSRLSSFGYSGTIAHGLFVLIGARSFTQFSSSSSLYRCEYTRWLAKPSGRLVTPSLHVEVRNSHVVLITWTLAVLSHHVVGRSIMNAGVGYVGLALTTDVGRRRVSSGIPQPSLPKGLWIAESQLCKQRRVRTIVTVVSPLRNTSQTETRCLNRVESRSL